jgi:hypothetical protein
MEYKKRIADKLLKEQLEAAGAVLIEEGASSLKTLAKKIDTEKMREPSFMMVLTGVGTYAYKREDGVCHTHRMLKRLIIMKVLLCTPYLETPDVVSSGIGTWARNIMAYNQETDNSIDIVPVSFDRHTHIEEYTVGGFKRYYSGIKEVGRCN